MFVSVVRRIHDQVRRGGHLGAAPSRIFDGKVVGSTAEAAADIAEPNTVFDVAVSAAGAVTLQQFAEIDHAAPGVSSDYGAQQVVLGADLVSLSATTLISDGGGDSAGATKSIDLGGDLVFDDDGPSASIARTHRHRVGDGRPDEHGDGGRQPAAVRPVGPGERERERDLSQARCAGRRVSGSRSGRRSACPARTRSA